MTASFLFTLLSCFCIGYTVSDLVDWAMEKLP